MYLSEVLVCISDLESKDLNIFICSKTIFFLFLATA